MLTAALVLLVLWLAVSLGAVALLFRAAVLEVRAQARLIRHLRDRINGYRAEMDALSLAPPAAAVAALTPDDPALLPAQVEQWLREGAN